MHVFERSTLSGLAAALLLAACGAPPTSSDAGSPHDAGRSDAAVVDGGRGDAGARDAGSLDAGSHDAGQGDAGLDAGAADAGVTDAGGPDAGAVDAGAPDAGPPEVWPNFAGRIALRLIAANLTSGNQQSYDPGHGTRILQALGGGDVVLLQEFNFGTNTPAELRQFVDTTFDGGFFFVRGGGNIPNGVISRFPILDGGTWDDSRTTDREFVWAQIDLPGPVDLFAVSVHLLTAGPPTRDDQVTQLLQYVSANVPESAHLVIGGDFNTDVRTEPALGTLGAVVITDGPWPTDNALPDGGNGNTSTNRAKPYDWVVVSPDLHAMARPVVVGGQVFSSGLVFDTRVFSPLSAAPPALVGDSSATNMQHMAVVRDFALPP